MKINSSYFTNKGPRKNNEDSILIKQISDNNYIFAIADGLGGMQGGQIASSIAINYLKKNAKNIINDIQININHLEKWITHIHYIILKKQKEKSAINNMATTLTVAIIIKEILYYAHVGDTRISMSRNNGIKRLTKDHSERQKLYDDGKLTRQEFRLYKRKNIINNALGIKEKLYIEINKIYIKENDTFILTSDGVHDKLLIQELKKIININKQPSLIIQNIKEEVESRIPDDNYSCIVFTCKTNIFL